MDTRVQTAKEATMSVDFGDFEMKQLFDLSESIFNAVKQCLAFKGTVA
jgi:hypothetical protein